MITIIDCVAFTAISNYVGRFCNNADPLRIYSAIIGYWVIVGKCKWPFAGKLSPPLGTGESLAMTSFVWLGINRLLSLAIDLAWYRLSATAEVAGGAAAREKKKKKPYLCSVLGE